MIVVFLIGYMGIVFEESVAFNKSGVALLMAVSLWVIRSLGVNLVLTRTWNASRYFSDTAVVCVIRPVQTWRWPS